MIEVRLKAFKGGGFLPPLFIRLLAFVCVLTPALVNAEVTNSNYELGAGDLIRIQVYGEEDLTLETRLDEKGRVDYPFIGEITVVGRTVADLAATIDKGLRGDYIVDPEVQVTVQEYRDFYINGAVRAPGGYPFVPGLTIRKATALAGGLTELASPSKIFLIREREPDQRYKVSLDTKVGPGDTVIVEEGLF